jgi:hypothetical protein
MKPKQLAEELGNLLNSSLPAMKFPEIARQLKVPQWEIDHKLYSVRKYLERDHTPTILVTEHYFKLGDEPADVDEAMKCCALHGRAAVGLRLLFKERNDLLGIIWLKLNQRNSAGIQCANIDRITVGHSVKKLSIGKAKELVDKMGEPRIPFHETEFKALMGTKKK